MCEQVRTLTRSELIFTLLWALWRACTRKQCRADIVSVEQTNIGWMQIPYTEWLYLRWPDRE